MKDKFVSAIDRDTDAFKQGHGCLQASQVDAGAERRPHQRESQEATQQATLVAAGRASYGSSRARVRAGGVLSVATKNSASDAGVAGLSLRTAAEGAWLNVRIQSGGYSPTTASRPRFATKGCRSWQTLAKQRTLSIARWTRR